MPVLGTMAVSHQDIMNIKESTGTLTYGLCYLEKECADVRLLAHACAGKHGHFTTRQKEYKGRYWYINLRFMLPGTKVCSCETL